MGTVQTVPEPLADGADNTAWLQDWFNALKPGTTVEFPPLARYKVEGQRTPHPALTYVVKSALIIRRDGLTINGNGTTLYAETTGPGDELGTAPGDGRRVNSGRTHIEILADNVTVNNLHVEGARQHVERDYTGWLEMRMYHGQNGWLVHGTQIVLQDCSATDVLGDGIKCDGPNLLVHNPTIRRAGRHGVCPIGATDCWVIGGVIDRCRRSAVASEPGINDYTRGFLMAGTTVIKPGVSVAYAKGNTENFTLWGVHVVGKPLLVRLTSTDPKWRTKNIHILHCDSDTYAGNNATVPAFGVDGLEVRGCWQPYSVGKAYTSMTAFVGVRECVNVDVHHNDLGPREGVPEVLEGSK